MKTKLFCLFFLFIFLMSFTFVSHAVSILGSYYGSEDSSNYVITISQLKNGDPTAIIEHSENLNGIIINVPSSCQVIIDGRTNYIYMFNENLLYTMYLLNDTWYFYEVTSNPATPIVLTKIL